MVVFALAIALSGIHQATAPSGLHIIRSGDEYNEVLKKAFALSNGPLVKVDRGEILSNDEMTKLRQAAVMYDELNLFHPEMMATYVASGRIHLLMGEESVAESDFKQAINNAPMQTNAATFTQVRALLDQAHEFLAQCLFQDKDWQGCYDESNEAIAINPGAPNNYVVRARAEIQLQNIMGAKADLTSVLKMDPHNVPARDLLWFLNQPSGSSETPGTQGAGKTPTAPSHGGEKSRSGG